MVKSDKGGCICYVVGPYKRGGGKGVPASAGTAGGWVFGAGKCRGIAIWVPANAGHAGLRKHF